MRSPSTYSHTRFFSRGFTLVEIVVVMAIFTLLIGLGLFMSMDSYRGFSFRSERDVVVSLLEKARSRAMANIYQTPWGVCTIGSDYVIFRGTTCTPGGATNESLAKKSPAVGVSGFSSGIWFSQLSGTTTGGTVVVTQDTRTSIYRGKSCPLAQDRARPTRLSRYPLRFARRRVGIPGCALSPPRCSSPR